MAITLANALSDQNALYFTPEFRQTIEDHLSYLVNHPDSEWMEISDDIAYKYHGDLTGLLQHYDVPNWLHWTIMRMNRMTNMQGYDESRKKLQIPHRTTVQRIMKIHRVSQ